MVMDSIQIGPFTLQYTPESNSSDWTESAHWYVDGNVCVTGVTPEECVRRLRTRLLKTFLATPRTPPESLARAERLIAQVETLEEWLRSRASQEAP
jgi:hypothetical protein